MQSVWKALLAVVGVASGTALALVFVLSGSPALASFSPGVLAPALALGATSAMQVEATTSGDLADTINVDVALGKTKWSSEVNYLWTTTPGTTTTVTVYCVEDTESSFTNPSRIPTCNASGVCTSHTLTYDISSISGFSTTVKARAPWVRCVFDDTSDGTGTIAVTPVRSAP